MDRELVGKLLEAGEDPSPLLLEALWEGDRDCVAFLLAAGADPNKADGVSPLYAARDVDLTRLLLDAGARVPQESGLAWDQFHEYSLHQAAEAGDYDRLELLLSHGDGARCLGCYDDLGITPLGQAAAAGRARVCELLLAHGADPNDSNPDMIAGTPLPEAASRGYLEVARVLLRYGADPDHAWGMNATGRYEMWRGSPEMRAALDEADRNWRSRRLTAESVRRRFPRWDGPDPRPVKIRGENVWVFGEALAWNWKWGVLKGAKVRYYASLQECLERLPVERSGSDAG